MKLCLKKSKFPGSILDVSVTVRFKYLAADVRSRHLNLGTREVSLCDLRGWIKLRNFLLKNFSTLLYWNEELRWTKKLCNPYLLSSCRL